MEVTLTETERAERAELLRRASIGGESFAPLTARIQPAPLGATLAAVMRPAVGRSHGVGITPTPRGGRSRRARRAFAVRGDTGHGFGRRFADGSFGFSAKPATAERAKRTRRADGTRAQRDSVIVDRLARIERERASIGAVASFTASE